MSTDINGYFVEDPFTLVVRLWPALLEARRPIERDLVAREACRIADYAAFEGRAEPRAVVKAYRELQEGDDLPGFRMYLGAHDGQHAAIVYATPALEDAFAALDGVREYGYWNSSERPSSVTDEAWESRREFWDEITPTGRLHETMLSWKMPTGGYELLEASRDIAGHLPPVAERAAVVARRFVFAAADQEGGEASMSRIMHLADESRYPEIVGAVAALMPDYTTPEGYQVTGADIASLTSAARQFITTEGAS